VEPKIPHDIGAEQAFIGCCLEHRPALIAGLQNLSPRFFYDPAHKDIWKAIQSLAARSVDVNKDTLAAELERTGKLAAVGGKVRIAQILKAVINPIEYDGLLDIIISRGRKRMVGEVAQKIIDRVYEGDSNADEDIEFGISQLSSLVDPHETDIELFRDESAISYYMARREKKFGVETPWDTFNDEIGPIPPGGILVLIAPPKVRKTFWAIQFGITANNAGKNVLFINLENPPDMVAARAHALKFGLRYSELRRGDLASENDFTGWLDQIKNWYGKQFIISTPDMRDGTRKALQTKIEQYRPDLLIIDGLYMAEYLDRSEWSELLERYRFLQELALRYQIPILSTHQLTKETWQPGTRPSLGNIAIGSYIAWFVFAMVGVYKMVDDWWDDEYGFTVMCSREGRPVEWFCDWDLDPPKYVERKTPRPREAGSELL